MGERSHLDVTRRGAVHLPRGVRLAIRPGGQKCQGAGTSARAHSAGPIGSTELASGRSAADAQLHAVADALEPATSAASIAHDLQTPVAMILGLCARIEAEGVSDEQAGRHPAPAGAGRRRCRARPARCSTRARPTAAERRPVDVGAIARECRGRTRRARARARARSSSSRAEQPAWVLAEPRRDRVGDQQPDEQRRAPARTAAAACAARSGACAARSRSRSPTAAPAFRRRSASRCSMTTPRDGCARQRRARARHRPRDGAAARRLDRRRRRARGRRGVHADAARGAARVRRRRGRRRPRRSA